MPVLHVLVLLYCIISVVKWLHLGQGMSSDFVREFKRNVSLFCVCHVKSLCTSKSNSPLLVVSQKRERDALRFVELHRRLKSKVCDTVAANVTSACMFWASG